MNTNHPQHVTAQQSGRVVNINTHSRTESDGQVNKSALRQPNYKGWSEQFAIWRNNLSLSSQVTWE